MSRFYGSLSGQAKTEATRQGSAKSGISCHVRGWDVGVKVLGYDYVGQDVFDVYATSGSNGHHPARLLGTVRSVDGQLVWQP